MRSQCGFACSGFTTFDLLAFDIEVKVCASTRSFMYHPVKTYRYTAA